MRVLFLAKRHPQQRDLLERPYGRFFHLPAGLAARGHEVHVALLSHRALPGVERQAAGVTWLSEDLAHPLRYRRRVLERLRTLRPDWIVGASDLYFGVLAARWGHAHGARVAIDAYDNFESYAPWALPLHALWRRALGSAHLVTAPGPHLLEHLGRNARGAASAVVPMAADPTFRPLDRSEARRRLGLPADALLVGYCGSLFPGRGAETLFAAFQRLREKQSRAVLVASGRMRLHVPAFVHHVGYVPDDQVPQFLAALDVACVTAAAGTFGDYAYPAKLYEALACRVPLVATDVPPIRWILGAEPRQLAPPGDAAAMAERLEAQLGNPFVPPAPPDWDASVRALERALASG